MAGFEFLEVVRRRFPRVPGALPEIPLAPLPTDLGLIPNLFPNFDRPIYACYPT